MNKNSKPKPQPLNLLLGVNPSLLWVVAGFVVALVVARMLGFDVTPW